MGPGVSAERFFHLDGWSGWAFARAPGPSIELSRRGMTLAGGPLPPPPIGGSPLRPPHRGLAFDPGGSAIGVNDQGTGLCLCVCLPSFEAPLVCCQDPPECWRIAGQGSQPIADLAVSGRGRLYVALPDAGQVLVLRIDPAGEIARYNVPRPIALAVENNGTLHVIDGASSTLLTFDAQGRQTATATLPFAADRIAVSDQGRIAVVQTGTSNVAVGLPFQALAHGRELGPALTFTGDRLALYDAPSGRVVKYRIDGTTLRPVIWSKRAAWSAIALRGETLYGLVDPCTIREVSFEQDGFFQPRAVVVLGPFDSGEPRTEWHRVLAEIHPAADAELTADVEVLATEDCESFDPSDDAPGGPWTESRALGAPRAGTVSELALQGATGRFAYLRLTLRGDGRHAPQIRWVRLEFPRNSYLRYLPALFSEDPESKDLLGRFLSLFEAENAGHNETISRLHTLFRPLSADPEWLPWLADRLAFFLDADWTTEKRRKALAQIFALYRKRGTHWALARYLELYGGTGIRILESFKNRRTFILGTDQTLGCTTVLPGSCAPPRMQLNRGIALGSAKIDSRPYVEVEAITEGKGELVILVPETLASKIDRIQAIAELEAPAGTLVRVMVARSRARLGQVGRLGLDATLGAHRPWLLASENDGLPKGSSTLMLLDREPASRADIELGRGARLGMSSKI